VGDMGQFVDDHVIDDRDRRHDKPPAEIQTVVGRAGSPAPVGASDVDRVVRKSKTPRPPLDARGNDLLRLFFVPRDKKRAAAASLFLVQDETTAQMKRHKGAALDFQGTGFPQEQKLLAADEFFFSGPRFLPQPGKGPPDPAGVLADELLDGIERGMRRGADNQGGIRGDHQGDRPAS